MKIIDQLKKVNLIQFVPAIFVISLVGNSVFGYTAPKSEKSKNNSENQVEAATTQAKKKTKKANAEDIDLSKIKDGTTSSGCWIFAGSWTPEGNQMARRDNADPSGLGNTLGWAWAWPLNRRILYNRASADPQGKPWDPKRQSSCPAPCPMCATA